MNKENYYLSAFDSYDNLERFYAENKEPGYYPNWIDKDLMRYFESRNLRNRLYKETARCYASVFKDEPWQEAFRDEQGNFYDISYWDRWNQEGLSRAYPIIETAEYIKSETTKPESVFIWQTDPNNPRRIIGFAWGYSIESIQALSESKWPSPTQEEAKVVADVLSKQTTSSPIWYFSEIGLLAQFRGQSIAYKMSKELISKAPNDQDIVVRTNASSPLTIILNRLEFEQVIGPRTAITDSGLEPDYDNVINILDPINQERVVYVLTADRRRQ